MGNKLSQYGDNNVKSLDVIKYYLDNEFKQFGLSLNIPKTVCYIIDEYFSMNKWNQRLHGNDIKFVSDTRITCDSSKSQSALIQTVFTKQEFVMISFAFIVYSYSYYSWMGLIKYPLINDNDYVNQPFDKYENTFAIGTYHGMSHCSTKDNNKNSSFSPASVQINGSLSKNKQFHKFENGDKFIFQLDFNKSVCNVFINTVKKSHKLLTWNNLPEEIIAAYTHSCSKQSDIEFVIIDYDYR